MQKNYRTQGIPYFSEQSSESEKVDDLSENKLNCYFEELQKNGWELMVAIDKATYGWDKYTYIKDNDVMSITQSEYIDKLKDFTMFYKLDIFINKGYRGTAEGRTSKDTAKTLIQNHIDSLPPDNYRYGNTVYKLVEMDEKEIYEKMGIQVVKAYTKDAYLGEYYIYKDYGCKSTCWEFRGHIFVADVDNDGEYELVSVCDVGSGRRIIQIDAYKLKNISSGDSTEFLHKAYSAAFSDFSNSLEIID